MPRRLISWVLLGTALVLGLLLLALVYVSMKDYDAEFAFTKGRLVAASLEPAGTREEGKRYWLTLRGDHGLTTECGLLVPAGRSGPFPAIVLLGGKTTGKYAVDYALGVRDVIIIAPDYPYTPRNSYTLLEVLSDLPAIRQTLFDMIPSVGLAMDYLWTRDNVDTGKVVLVGYSFGAPYVPYLTSHDRRFAAAIMVEGGGDLQSLIRFNVRRYKGPLFSSLVGFLSGVLLRPLEPLRHVKDVSPTPLVMINGEYDEQVPRKNTEVLFDAAREPKRLIWLPARHVHPRDTTLTRTIIKVLVNELSVLGVIPPASGKR
jgi:pimeloyl-ACP methyl ester carboxylesterase